MIFHPRPLGKSGIEVSSICLGTMTYGQQNTPQEAFDQLEHARSFGVNFMDTAELYAIPPKPETQGATEEIIGDYFAKYGRRNDWVLATKVIGRSGHMDWFREGNKLPRLDHANIEEALHKSLHRLKTDVIDLYQLHWPDRDIPLFGAQLGYRHSTDYGTPMEESLESLAKFVQQGKIRAIGLSNETPWGVMKFLQLAQQHDLPCVVSVQNAYNLLNRTYEMGLSEVSLREQVACLPYSPLAGGVLSGKYLGNALPEGSRKALFDRVDRYEKKGAAEAVAAYQELAKSHGLTSTQLALAFCHGRDFVTSTIIGATGMAQLQENLNAFTIDLSDEVLAGIEEIHLRQPNPCP